MTSQSQFMFMLKLVKPQFIANSQYLASIKVKIGQKSWVVNKRVQISKPYYENKILFYELLPFDK